MAGSSVDGLLYVALSSSAVQCRILPTTNAENIKRFLDRDAARMSWGKVAKVSIYNLHPHHQPQRLPLSRRRHRRYFHCIDSQSVTWLWLNYTVNIHCRDYEGDFCICCHESEFSLRNHQSRAPVIHFNEEL